MAKMTRLITRALVAALLLAGGLAGSARVASAQADRSIIHIDGYLSSSQGCLILREHEGGIYALGGNIAGLMSNDHVRLEGRQAPDRCGAPGFDVLDVHTLWADDNHRSTYYDHLQNGSFQQWALSTGRLRAEPRGYRSGRPNGYGPRGGPQGPPPGSYGSPRYGPPPGSNGYGQGPNSQGERFHGRVTYTGRIYDNGNGCPILRRSNGRTYKLSGDLGGYGPGDAVRVSGDLVEVAPYAADQSECGSGWTLRISSIR